MKINLNISMLNAILLLSRIKYGKYVLSTYNNTSRRIVWFRLMTL